jgi:hypothetical protein
MALEISWRLRQAGEEFLSISEKGFFSSLSVSCLKYRSVG